MVAMQLTPMSTARIAQRQFSTSGHRAVLASHPHVSTVVSKRILRGMPYLCVCKSSIDCTKAVIHSAKSYVWCDSPVNDACWVGFLYPIVFLPQAVVPDHSWVNLKAYV